MPARTATRCAARLMLPSCAYRLNDRISDVAFQAPSLQAEIIVQFNQRLRIESRLTSEAQGSPNFHNRIIFGSNMLQYINRPVDEMLLIPGFSVGYQQWNNTVNDNIFDAHVSGR